MLKALLAILSLDFTSPTILLEPDGDIALEWYETNRVLTVSISEKGRMNYAGHIGESYFHGSTDDINEIKDVLLRLYL